jgi:hypothetical protein
MILHIFTIAQNESHLRELCMNESSSLTENYIHAFAEDQGR